MKLGALETAHQFLLSWIYFLNPFPEEDIGRVTAAEGKAGTLYFLDTGGLHRGGYHIEPGERRVSLTTFSTSADLQATQIKSPKNFLLNKGILGIRSRV